MTNLLTLFKSDVAKVRERRAATRKALELARREYEEMKTLPPPADETCARFMRILDQRAAGFYESHLKARLRGLAPDTAKLDDSQGLQVSMILFQNPGQFSGYEMEGALVYFFRNAIQAGLLQSLKGLGMKCGPSAADRVQKLVDLEAKVKLHEQDDKALDAELDALRTELAQ